MKRILVLLTLSLTPLYAFGDYSPGRVRASAEADLNRLQGNGRYENVASAHALQLETDGKGVTTFRLSLDRRPEIAFTVRAIQPNRCGRTFLASVKDEGRVSELRIDELSPAACREPGDLVWRVSLTTDEGGGASSRLVLEGNPEYFLLTQ
jgi:hypothetical protein